MVILIWVITATLLIGWSLCGWALHALLVHGPALLEALPGWIQSLPYPAVLEQWWPQWQEWAVASATLVVAGLGWLGAAGVVIVRVLWALGTGALLLLALLLTWAVKKIPKPPAAPPPQANVASS
jgi:hypothetical protein